MNFNPALTFIVSFIFFLILIFNPFLFFIAIVLGFFIWGFKQEEDKKGKNNPFNDVKKQSKK